MTFAHIAPNSFFKLLDRVGPLNATGISEFLHPLMFFEGTDYFYLYKPVSGVVYSTKILVDAERNVATTFGTGQEEITGDTLIGTPIDNFRLKLMKEFNAEEVAEPLNMSDILQTHNHDMHSHAGVAVDDIRL